MFRSNNVFNIKTCLFFLLVFILAGCNQEPDRIPFPKQESTYAFPKTTPLHLTEPKPLHWQVHRADSLKSPVVKDLKIDKIPASPIDFGNFIDLPTKPEESRFDFASLPDTSFDLASIPKTKFKYSVSVLPAPQRNKAGLPRIKDSASRSIFIYAEEQGLIGNLVQAIIMDHEGMMWFATNMGIVRFDGEYFEIYDVIGLDKTGRKFTVININEDKRGRIWFTTLGGGLFAIDPREKQLLRLGKQQGLSGNANIGMHWDVEGRIWLCDLTSGVEVIDPEAQTIQHLNASNGLKVMRPILSIGDLKGRIWIGGFGDTICIYSPAEKKISYLAKSLFPHSESGVIPILADSKDRIWAAGPTSLIEISSREGRIRRFSYPPNYLDDQVFDAVEDANGRIWLAEENKGLTVLDPATDKVKRITASLGLGTNSLTSIEKDNKGNVWIGSLAGLLEVPANTGMMVNLTAAQGLSSPNVWGFAEDSLGRIWVGTTKGADLIDGRNNTIRHLGKTINDAQMADKFAFGGPDSLWIAGGGVSVIDFRTGKLAQFHDASIMDKGAILGIIKDSRGKIWLSTTSKGAIVIDQLSNTVSNAGRAEGMLSNQTWTVEEDGQGRIWAPTDSGMNVISADRKSVSTLLLGKRPNDKPVFGALKDSLGRIWIAGLFGLYMVDPVKSTVTTFTEAEGLDASDVYTLMTHDGLIYAGTGKGLTVLKQPDADDSTWKVTNYRRAQGLGGLNFNSGAVLVSSTGQIWWGIDKIVTIMDFPRPDSIPSKTFIRGIDIMDKPATFKEEERSFAGLQPGDTLWSSANDSFFVAGKDAGGEIKNKWDWDSLGGPYQMPNRLSLPYSQNFLKFYFSSNELSHPDKKRYRYILEGIDRNWSPVSQNPFTENYRDLPPGNYRFRVSSRGLNGKWSNPVEFPLSILPPWWRTWWAYFIYALLIGAIAWAFVQARSKALLRENLALESKVTQRTVQLRKSLEDLREMQAQLIQREKMASLGELTAGVAHEIQNPLNFVNNFSELNNELITDLKEEIKKGNMIEVSHIADNIISNGVKITEHGKRADTIVKGMLQHSRASSGLKEPTDINLLADEYLRLSYHGLRAKDKGFNASIKTNFDHTLPRISVIPQDLGRVLLNIYNNAFYSVAEKAKKQAGNFDPTVTVSTKREENQLLITIRDNGLGISESVRQKIFQPFFTTKPTGQGTGLGLSLSYDIITKVHDGSIELNTVDGEYAEFILSLPIEGHV